MPWFLVNSVDCTLFLYGFVGSKASIFISFTDNSQGCKAREHPDFKARGRQAVRFWLRQDAGQTRRDLHRVRVDQVVQGPWTARGRCKIRTVSYGGYVDEGENPSWEFEPLVHPNGLIAIQTGTLFGGFSPMVSSASVPRWLRPRLAQWVVRLPGHPGFGSRCRTVIWRLRAAFNRTNTTSVSEVLKSLSATVWHEIHLTYPIS